MSGLGREEAWRTSANVPVLCSKNRGEGVPTRWLRASGQAPQAGLSTASILVEPILMLFWGLRAPMQGTYDTAGHTAFIGHLDDCGHEGDYPGVAGWDPARGKALVNTSRSSGTASKNRPTPSLDSSSYPAICSLIIRFPIALFPATLALCHGRLPQCRGV